MTALAPSALSFRPSWWSVASFGQPWIFVGTLLVLTALAFDFWFEIYLVITLFLGVGLLVLGLLQGILRRCSRLYTVTTDHARVRAGVFTRVDSTLPLLAITQSTRTSSLFERFVGAGTISLGGNDGPLLRFLFIARAAARLHEIRRLLEAARMPPTKSIPVIGLSGGIGAGKSTVARAFADQNCLVIDADADANAALGLPHVRDSLVAWWGPSVLNAEGQVDRKAVASIVFANPAERARLEGLVHPIIRADRGRLIARAAAEGRIAAVIDAPLLFEAGSDAECDVLVFVDTPREIRLARLAANRGWNEEELTRRESAQISLEEKKRRSHHVISNAGDPQTIQTNVREILSAAIHAGRSAPPESTGLPER